MDRKDINQEYQLAKWIHRNKGEIFANIMATSAVQHAKRKENSYECVKFCKACNLFMGFRSRKCWKCGNEDLEIMRRFVSLGRISYRIEDRIIRRVALEKFVNSFDGVLKNVTYQILVERLIFCDDCVKLLSEDFHLTEQTIRRYLREIAKRLQIYEENL